MADLVQQEADKIAAFIQKDASEHHHPYYHYMILSYGTQRLDLYAQACRERQIPVQITSKSHHELTRFYMTLNASSTLSPNLRMKFWLCRFRGPYFWI